MAKQYWTDEDLSPTSEKIKYLADYTLKNGRTKGLKEIEIQHLADLTLTIDTQAAVEYFDTLPSNFKKAFKTAYRQKQHKEKQSSSLDSKVAIEFDNDGKYEINSIVEMFEEANPDHGVKTVAELRSSALRWVKACAITHVLVNKKTVPDQHWRKHS